MNYRKEAEKLNEKLFHTSSHKYEDRVDILEAALKECAREAYKDAAEIAITAPVWVNNAGLPDYTQISKAIWVKRMNL